MKKILIDYTVLALITITVMIISLIIGDMFGFDFRFMGGFFTAAIYYDFYKKR